MHIQVCVPTEHARLLASYIALRPSQMLQFKSVNILIFAWDLNRADTPPNLYCKQVLSKLTCFDALLSGLTSHTFFLVYA